ncbi:MAG: tripartite tricarboxylate transporter TctB family protein [Candidatus Rokuibacteriota bacterium]
MKSWDVLAGGLILGLSAVLLWQSGRIPSPPLIPIGPAFYPRIILILLAFLAITLVAETLVGRSAPVARPAPEPEGRRRRLVALCFLLFALYTAALPWLGYRLSTTLFVATMQWSLGPRTVRSLPLCLLVGAATALVTYAVFQLYLHLLLPRGRLVP